jgi:hypothetical protein
VLSPVSLYEVITLAPTVAIVVNVPPYVFLSILKPSSSLELSVQERFIWLVDTADATRSVGASGAFPPMNFPNPMGEGPTLTVAAMV